MQSQQNSEQAARLQEVTATLKALSGQETECSKDDLLGAAERLKDIVPDNFEAWRVKAELWVAAIRRLQTRELTPDESITLMGIPLLENNLRAAAEEALRQSAHFAPTVEKRVQLVDEANAIRRVTWF